MPGAYLIMVSEHGSFDYRLSVRGDDGSRSNQGNVTEPLNLHADGNRQCRYRFDFSRENGTVTIRGWTKMVVPPGLRNARSATQYRQSDGPE
jgi:hypothetical protein